MTAAGRPPYPVVSRPSRFEASESERLGVDRGGEGATGHGRYGSRSFVIEDRAGERGVGGVRRLDVMLARGARAVGGERDEAGCSKRHQGFREGPGAQLWIAAEQS